MSGDRSATALAEHVFKRLDKYGIGENKLVSQTYDGVAVTVVEMNVLQSHVRQKYSDALFVHYCAFRLNLVLYQAICILKECKISLRQ
jgi:hypothetical protein